MIDDVVEDVVFKPVRTGVTDLGSRAAGFLEWIAELSYLLASFCKHLAHRWDRRDFTLFAAQMTEIGLRSIGVALITSAFTGMAVALQLSYGLARFGAKTYVGTIVAFALVRELSPVLTSLLVGGRVGSGIAAELGSMAVTEQIDAMRALGADPIRRLVLPRVLSCMIVFPILTTISDLVGILGGMVVTYLESGVGTRFFIEAVTRSLKVQDVASGVAKTVFFGACVGLIACHSGINTRGGTVGLGNAVKKTVVSALVVILVLDFLLSKIFLLVL